MRYSTKQISSYLAMAYGFAWAIWLVVYLLTKDVENQFTIQIVMTVGGVLGMWCPGVAVLMLWLRNNRQKVMQPSFQLHLPRAWQDYLIGWLLPVPLMVLGAALYFALFPGSFTTDFPAFRQLPQAAAIPEDQYVLIALTQIVSGVLIGPFINTVFALGEEIGWRGFLFPAIAERFSPWRTHLLMGVIWGLWHAPFTAMGHNYGTTYPGFPWVGMAAMCIFAFGGGVWLSYITERSGSIWPAALGHGAINSIGGTPLLFIDPTTMHQLLGPHIAGLLSSLPGVLLACWLIPRFKKLRTQEGNIPYGNVPEAT